MDNIRYVRLAPEQVPLDCLDGFVRHQEVKECWRKLEGEWRLMPIAFTEEWAGDTLRAKASELKALIKSGHACFGAFDGEALCGFATLENEIFDDDRRYIALMELQVSAPYRGRHIGSELFYMCLAEARALGARRLYISAHSSKESQAFYRAVGCVEAERCDPEAVRLEPCDVQMERRV